MTTTVATRNGTHAIEEENRRGRSSHLQWLKVSDLVPSPRAQREFQPAWANALASNFELEGMGFPVISARGGNFYIVDGQHRVAALKLLGFEDDTVQCEVYENLTEEAEAELFLERNHNKTVAAFDKFKIAVAAGRTTETTIERIVRMNDLHLGRSRDGGISAVGALRKVYDRIGEAGLGKTLRIIRDAYGTAGFEALVIDGLSLCLHRFNGQIDEASMIERLSKTAGGLNGLLQPAEKARIQLGQPKVQCIAATATSIYNRDQKGKKLAPWWKE